MRRLRRVFCWCVSAGPWYKNMKIFVKTQSYANEPGRRRDSKSEADDPGEDGHLGIVAGALLENCEMLLEYDIADGSPLQLVGGG
ncbi:unnamed protein product [Dibothriocephalus latus]|uniref:Ubiquitin-like domain-containing protein n=1 Tax=Dibothriocephalus latus TaxID=60516 RepID=A0A3P6RGS8_DIBLA|nr:unnamed protein product [Dibothriocephalus latus]